jgi:hypothetical protein
MVWYGKDIRLLTACSILCQRFAGAAVDTVA